MRDNIVLRYAVASFLAQVTFVISAFINGFSYHETSLMSMVVGIIIIGIGFAKLLGG